MLVQISFCLPLLLQTALGEKEEGAVEDFYDFHTALTILNAACENELSEYAARIIAVENQLSNITGMLPLCNRRCCKTCPHWMLRHDAVLSRVSKPHEASDISSAI